MWIAVSRQKISLPLAPDLQSYVAGISCDPIGLTQPIVTQERLNANLLKVRLQFQLDEAVQQDDWQLHVDLAFAASFHWSPHLTPTERNIIDQHSFRSPALLAHDEQRLLMMLPDLDVMVGGNPVRWYLDHDAVQGRWTLGMSNYLVKQHVIYERSPGAVYPPGQVEIGFYLMSYEDPSVLQDPWRPALALLWERWGAPRFHQGEPLAGSLESYVHHTYEWAFERWGSSVWQEFDLDGRRVGAAVFIVEVSQSPNFEGEANERELRSIWNQAWFSSLRSAGGMYRYGKRYGDEDKTRRALLAKELALAAPQRHGWFPSVLATEMETHEVAGGQVSRSRGWSTAYWGNSNRNPWKAGDSVHEAPYHILDMSWTALWMLRWYEELEPDQRLLDYAIAYAESLLQLQDTRGFFPAWLDYHTLEPLPILSDSPQTACSVTMLLKLHQVTGERRYAKAALRAADAVAEAIVPEGRWEDFETYWSCSSYGCDHVGRKYERNNMYKQNNLSMFWSAEAFLRCFEYTGNFRYRKLGERCLDELLMTQASWQPPYLYVPVLGGFGVMNGDGEWNDARQSLFAELILEFGLLLERTEYVERAIAALRCSFVMMYCPENPQVKEQWERAYPFFNHLDYGFTMENYGHSGKVNNTGQGMGRFTIFDWGNGAAAESYLRMKDHHPELLARYGL